MRRFLISILSAGLILGFGSVLADQHEEGENKIEPASPMELFVCSYNEGKQARDLEPVIAEFNKWADDRKITEYSAWIMTPYYAGTEQDFDVLWFGGAQKAKALGRIQDLWLAEGGEVQEEFDEVITCDTHSNFAVLRFKKPPEREDPSRLVVSFSDCSMKRDTGFADVASALSQWSNYRDGHGSTAGMWVFFPAFGDGTEEFDFKFVTAHQNLEDLGADYDQYSESGWQKAEELFADKLDCNAGRVYLAESVRTASSDD